MPTSTLRRGPTSRNICCRNPRIRVSLVSAVSSARTPRHAKTVTNIAQAIVFIRAIPPGRREQVNIYPPPEIAILQVVTDKATLHLTKLRNCWQSLRLGLLDWGFFQDFSYREIHSAAFPFPCNWHECRLI